MDATMKSLPADPAPTPLCRCSRSRLPTCCVSSRCKDPISLKGAAAKAAAFFDRSASAQFSTQVLFLEWKMQALVFLRRDLGRVDFFAFF